MILPHIVPKLDLSGSVAIVGSSAKLLKAKHGTDIDKFDHILRFNRAPTKDFEEVAGSRTTLRIVSNHVFLSRPFKRWKEDDIFVKRLRNTKLILARDPHLAAQRDKCIDSSIKLYTIQNSLDTYLQKHTKIQKLPTVGFMGIIITVLAGIRPVVFGWTTSTDESKSHYYNKRLSTTSEYHQWESEIYEIGQLIQNNQIEIR